MTAADRWAEQLAAWALPQHLLDAVEDSPYGWPQHLWKRRSDLASSEEQEPVTRQIVRTLAAPDGSIIDVGAGRGRASLPLAAEGHPLVAVEKDPAMAAGLREDATSMGLELTIVEAGWPDAAALVEPAAVVMCAHVVYDVPEIAPFIQAMHDSATSGVVIELTPEHPWARMAPMYQALHDLDRPNGPTIDDLRAVVAETIGVDPNIEWWEREGHLWFSGWEEITEYYGRRLVLPASRRGELRPLLEPHVTEADGRLYIGDLSRQLATMWWQTG